jgi:hypothetical protein
MRVWSRRGLTAVVVAAVLMASFGGAVRAQTAGPPDPDTPAPLYTINGLGPTKGDNVILLWDEELLQAIRPTRPAPARPSPPAPSAWPPPPCSTPGRPTAPRRSAPAAAATSRAHAGEQGQAISFAAYATLVDLFPSRADDFALQM